jgi:hypothetical protein
MAIARETKFATRLSAFGALLRVAMFRGVFDKFVASNRVAIHSYSCCWSSTQFGTRKIRDGVGI